LWELNRRGIGQTVSCLFILQLNLFTGNSFHKASTFRVVVDRRISISVESPLAAFAVLFGAFFVFNISYPNDAGATLEYVQR